MMMMMQMVIVRIRTSPSLAALNRSSISPSLFMNSCSFHFQRHHHQFRHHDQIHHDQEEKNLGT